MKKIETKIQNEQTLIRYEAADGTIFDIKEECESYEKTYKCAVRKLVENISIKHGTEYSLFGVGDDASDTFFVKPKGEFDLLHINMLLSMCNVGQKNLLSSEAVGRPLFVTLSCDEDYAWVTYLDELIKRATAGKYTIKEVEEAE